MEVDTSAWSGEGTFTQVLIAALRTVEEIAAVRVEDAPASRADTGYNFIANELFVTFKQRLVPRRTRLLGLFPWTRAMPVPALSIDDLRRKLASSQEFGDADYADEDMIQYLRTERVVAPYQTRGIKVVELVRIYRAAPPPAKAQ
jgi:hypothetical protein